MDVVSLYVADGTARIDTHAGNANTHIQRVVLPDGLEVIGNYAFYGYKNLKVVTEGDKDIHISFAYGKDAYGCIDLENGAGKPEIIVKPNGSAGTDDPLNQRASAGWKNCFTAVITQPMALVRVETLVKE